MAAVREDATREDASARPGGSNAKMAIVASRVRAVGARGVVWTPAPRGCIAVIVSVYVQMDNRFVNQHFVLSAAEMGLLASMGDASALRAN